MSSDAEPAATTAAPEKPRRFTPKLLVVGGGATLALMLVVGGAGWLLWPAADKPVAKVKVNKAAVQQAAAASAATASMPAAALPAASAAAVAEPAVALAPQDEAAPAPPPAPVPAATGGASRKEDPFDRLQRRLGQVLGAKAAVDAARSGEWRLVTRASTAMPAPQVARAPAQTVPQTELRASAERHAPHWAYEGRGGPQAWGRLKPEFGTCASGQRQSPIDIRDGLALQLEPLHFDYRPSSFGVIDNGHTVQVSVAPGNAIDIDGRRFELQQFHFHRPSEERINGRQFDMSVHLVHKDGAGRLAVVALLLERGAAQGLVQTVWNHLPLEKGEEAPARVSIDLNELLPKERGYYTYMGSLTTPPCSEGVQWVVMQQPVQVSATQIDIFSRLYPMNARPIQQAAGRMIKQSE